MHPLWCAFAFYLLNTLPYTGVLSEYKTNRTPFSVNISQSRVFQVFCVEPELLVILDAQ